MQSITSELIDLVYDIKTEIKDNDYKKIVEKIAEIHKMDNKVGTYYKDGLHQICTRMDIPMPDIITKEFLPDGNFLPRYTSTAKIGRKRYTSNVYRSISKAREEVAMKLLHYLEKKEFASY